MSASSGAATGRDPGAPPPPNAAASAESPVGARLAQSAAGAGAGDTRTVPVWVVGASGLLAGELMRLVELHPELELAGAVSREAGHDVRALHPHLAEGPRVAPTTFALGEAAEVLRAELPASGPAALVLGLPHARSAEAWRGLRAALGERANELVVVDLSADYRLRDPDDYARWYGGAHPDPAELERFVYGLPELFRERLRGARRIAAPGCFATALQLACVPAAKAGVLVHDRPWILHAITGSSGSGAEPKPGTHHPWRNGNVVAYALDGHRHEAELAQSLRACGPVPPIAFLPHSGPFVRGIHLTAALPLARPLALDDARALFADAYAGEPFVEVLAAGAPEVRRVAGSNRACLGVAVRGEVLTVLVALDNVIKGGAGQALQCLNLALGLPETRGLPRAGLACL